MVQYYMYVQCSAIFILHMEEPYDSVWWQRQEVPHNISMFHDIGAMIRCIAVNPALFRPASGGSSWHTQ